MISNKSINNIKPVVDAVNKKGFPLSPGEGSALGELLTLSYGYNKEAIPADSQDFPGFLHEVTAMQVNDGLDGHTATLETLEAELTTVLKSNIEFIHGTVNSIWKRTWAVAHDRVTSADIMPFYVNEIELPELIQQLADQGLFESAMDSVTSINSPEGFPELDEETLTEYLKSMSANINEKTAAMLAAKDEGWLTSIYNQYFRSVAPESFRRQPDNTFRPLVNLKYAEEYYIVSQLALNIAEEPPKGTKIPLSTLNKFCQHYSHVLYNALKVIVNNYNRAVANGQVITSIPVPSANEYGVNVIAPNYRKLLDRSGSPETVIGAALEGELNVRLDTLVESAARFNVLYNKEYARREEANETRYADELRAAILTYVREQSTEFSELDEHGFSRLRTELANISDREIQMNAYGNVRKAFISAYWPTSNADEFLTEMDRFVDENPDADPREASLAATIHVLTRHVLKNVKVG